MKYEIEVYEPEDGPADVHGVAKTQWHDREYATVWKVVRESDTTATVSVHYRDPSVDDTKRAGPVEQFDVDEDVSTDEWVEEKMLRLMAVEETLTKAIECFNGALSP